uniref:Uncharacterized protein n=1 Tax=viral metagenome TaxID=1070528 RepID=A0A6H1ZL13_9ZZZZ
MTTDTQVNKGGQPTKLTPDRQAIIIEFIESGNYISTACDAAGITRQTYLNWLEWGEEEAKNGGGLYFNFFEAIKKAQAQAEAERVARVRAAGIGGGVSKRRVTTFKDGTETIEETFQTPQWLADMTHLERRHPERWGRRDRTTVDINETRSIQITQVTEVRKAGEIVEGKIVKELPEGDTDATE